CDRACVDDSAVHRLSEGTLLEAGSYQYGAEPGGVGLIGATAERGDGESSRHRKGLRQAIDDGGHHTLADRIERAFDHATGGHGVPAAAKLRGDLIDGSFA